MFDIACVSLACFLCLKHNLLPDAHTSTESLACRYLFLLRFVHFCMTRPFSRCAFFFRVNILTFACCESLSQGQNVHLFCRARPLHVEESDLLSTACKNGAGTEKHETCHAEDDQSLRRDKDHVRSFENRSADRWEVRASCADGASTPRSAEQFAKTNA